MQKFNSNGPTGALSKKDMQGYLSRQDDNVPLKKMDAQLKEMDQDYNVMLMERIESKKQLEAKFQDIYRKIQANRDFTKAETKRVNDTLKAFRAKFEHNLRTLRQTFEKKINDMRQYNRDEFKNAEERLDRLEAAIEQEITDRIEESDEKLNETRDVLNRLQHGFDSEVQTRIEREKDILQEVDDAKYTLHKKIDQERTDKSLKLGAFKDNISQDLRRQHKYVEEFQREAMAEFMRYREQLEHEMADRFDNQDEIIDNLSQSIKTFQDTMEIIGETVC